MRPPRRYAIRCCCLVVWLLAMAAMISFDVFITVHVTATRLLYKFADRTTHRTSQLNGIKTPPLMENNIQIPKKEMFTQSPVKEEVKTEGYSYSNPLHWSPDWQDTIFPVEKVLERRKRLITERCQQLKDRPPAEHQWKERNRFHADVKKFKNMEYCGTYKAGYTFWSYMFTRQFKLIKWPTLSGPKANETIRFTVIRNPWQRLVAVWHDRFTMPFDDQRVRVMEHFCLGKKWDSLPPFSVFIEECILANWREHESKPGRTDQHWMDPHWAPVINRCSVCERDEEHQLDYYIAQENMNNEALHLLGKVVGLDNVKELLIKTQGMVLRKGEREHVSSYYQEHYRDVSQQNIEELREIYKYETFLFGYPDTPFTDFQPPMTM